MRVGIYCEIHTSPLTLIVAEISWEIHLVNLFFLILVLPYVKF